MDNEAFDCLTRSLAKSSTRRVLIRRLAGGALAALLGALGLEGGASSHRQRVDIPARSRGRVAGTCGRARRPCGA